MYGDTTYFEVTPKKIKYWVGKRVVLEEYQGLSEFNQIFCTIFGGGRGQMTDIDFPLYELFNEISNNFLHIKYTLIYAKALQLVKDLGYNSLQEVIGVALPKFRETELISRLNFSFTATGTEDKQLKNKCIKCNKCVKVCSYDARVLEYPNMSVDLELCRDCGACVSICPTQALTSEFAPRTSEDQLKALESVEFHNIVERENS